VLEEEEEEIEDGGRWCISIIAAVATIFQLL
jgi:hypothetical protein